MNPEQARQAIVLGGGLAGVLAAAALADHVNRVTIVERDHMPDGPEARKGVPQAHHAHMLMSSGAQAIEALVPGVTSRLLASGAHRISIRNGLVSCTPQGWVPRSLDLQFIITCGRPLLDWTVRELVLSDGRIEMRQDLDVHELCGDNRRVTGVRVRDRRTGIFAELNADLVVDATGRGSGAKNWLLDLGLPAVREETIDTGLTYTSRIYRAPDGAEEDFPVVTVMPNPADPRPGQAGALLPIEDGHWIVTLSGIRGWEPPAGEQEFVEFAKALRHPVIGELIGSAEPAGPVYRSRSTSNRRRYYEELSGWPDGFVVVGDAVAAFNPVYGHGMSVAAKGAAALRTGLERGGLVPGQARQLQRAISATANDAWTMAIGQDLLYPNVVGPRQRFPARFLRSYMNRVAKTSASRPSVAAVMTDIFTLSAPLSRLTAPKTVIGAVLGPTQPPLDSPPFTAKERELVSYPAHER